MAQFSVTPFGRNTAVDDVKLIAFYLPQFHPIPENDKWWGKGFTEWTNVTKARPLFEGHYQPRLPADLGFYDLRLRDIRHQQIDLAKNYGIHGFCYYYYWFSGHRLLEKPIEDMLADPKSDMPFCLCWANENWTRRWDAKEHEILLTQKYNSNDDRDFINGVVRFFRDFRYIRINGAPLLIVYRPQQLPDPIRSTNVWRDICRKAGIPDIHLCAALTHGNEEYREYGFDSGVQFPPHNLKLGTINRNIAFFGRFRGRVFDYGEIAEAYLSQEYEDKQVFKSVFPSWDNTARRKDSATIVLNGSPENYEYWLSQAIGRTLRSNHGPDPLVFINAWNEWAEGCYLEPDQTHRLDFLESTLRAARGQSLLGGFSHKGVPDQGRSTKQRTFHGDMADVVRFHFDRRFDQLRSIVSRNPRLKKSVEPLLRLRHTMSRWN